MLALLEAKCESAQPATVPANAGSTIIKGTQRGKWYKAISPLTPVYHPRPTTQPDGG
jgi:hypothetical protein